MFYKRIFLRQFQQTVVTPIFKFGNKEQIRNYRTLKIVNHFEKYFKERLTNHLIERKILFINRHSFKNNTNE